VFPFASRRSAETTTVAPATVDDGGYTLRVGTVELPRRTVITGAAVAAAWSIPLISQAIAAPAHANGSVVTPTEPCVIDAGLCVQTSKCSCTAVGATAVIGAPANGNPVQQALNNTGEIFALFGRNLSGYNTVPPINQDEGANGTVAVDFDHLAIFWNQPGLKHDTNSYQQIQMIVHRCNWTAKYFKPIGAALPKSVTSTNLCRDLAGISAVKTASWWTDYCAKGIAVTGSYGTQVKDGHLGYCSSTK